MGVTVIVKGDISQTFTLTKQVVDARRAVNRVIVLPGKSVTATDLRTWEIKTIAFAPVNGGTYRVDTRAAEVSIDLPADPVDGFQFHLRDFADSWAVNAAVLTRGDVEQRLSMRDADELALDYYPGTVTVVYDAATKNWGI